MTAPRLMLALLCTTPYVGTSLRHSSCGPPCANIPQARGTCGDDASACTYPKRSEPIPSHTPLFTDQVLDLLRERGLSSLDQVDGCDPDRDPDFSGLDEAGSGFCYGAPGASGGYAEYVFRTAAFELFGIDLGDSALTWKAGRNKDVAELVLEKEGQA